MAYIKSKLWLLTSKVRPPSWRNLPFLSRASLVGSPHRSPWEGEAQLAVHGEARGDHDAEQNDGHVAAEPEFLEAFLHGVSWIAQWIGLRENLLV